MNLSARLMRLEQLSGKGSCPACRLAKRRGSVDRGRPVPDELGLIVYEVCDVCGFRGVISLASYDEGLRPMLRLFYEATEEERYTDPRAWAASKWFDGLMFIEEEREKAERAAARAEEGIQAYRIPARRRRTPEVRLLERLEEESLRAHNRVYERLSARYGDEPFPELQARLDSAWPNDFADPTEDAPFLRGADVYLLRRLNHETYAWASCAEAERIALGDALPYTLCALEDCERRASDVVEKARRDYEEEEAAGCR